MVAMCCLSLSSFFFHRIQAISIAKATRLYIKENSITRMNSLGKGEKIGNFTEASFDYYAAFVISIFALQNLCKKF